MCFFRKKKNHAPTPAPVEETRSEKLLGDALFAQARTEGKPVVYGRRSGTNEPCAKIKELGPALLEDLGPDGVVFATYDETKEMLTLMLTFSYAEGSEEIKLVGECLDAFDLEEEEILPGDVTDYHICYITSKPVTEITFYAEGVSRADLKTAANSFFGQVFDWLDIVWETFEDEF